MRKYALSRRREASCACVVLVIHEVHIFFLSTLTGEKLGNLGVLALHGIDIPVNSDSICEIFLKCAVLFYIMIDTICSLPRIHICFSVIRNK